MAKAKAKKRFVLGEGYPFLRFSREIAMCKSKNLDGPTADIDKAWPGSELKESRYRLVLEEI